MILQVNHQLRLSGNKNKEPWKSLFDGIFEAFLSESKEIT